MFSGTSVSFVKISWLTAWTSSWSTARGGSTCEGEISARIGILEVSSRAFCSNSCNLLLRQLESLYHLVPLRLRGSFVPKAFCLVRKFCHFCLCLSFCLFLGFCRRLLLWNGILLEDGRKNRICFGLFLVFGFFLFLDSADGIHLWRNELCCAQSKSAGHTKTGRKYLATYVFLSYPKAPMCPSWGQMQVLSGLLCCLGLVLECPRGPFLDLLLVRVRRLSRDLDLVRCLWRRRPRDRERDLFGLLVFEELDLNFLVLEEAAVVLAGMLWWPCWDSGATCELDTG